jgi:hypothetical protein
MRAAETESDAAADAAAGADAGVSAAERESTYADV